MEQLNGLDSVLVLGEIPNIPLHIGALFIYDPSTSATGTLTFEQVRNLLSDVIDTSLPILRCRSEKLPFTIDKPYWVNDEDFNLDNHIQRFALPQPADWNELHDLTGRFHAQALNIEKPLWQAIFIEGLDNLDGLPSGCVGLILKIHHALADGNTAVKIFSALHTLSPEPNAPLIGEGVESQHPDFSAPGWSMKISRAYWHAISMPFKLAKNIADITPKLFDTSTSDSSSSSKIPKTPFNQMPSADRVIDHIRIPIEHMQALKEASQCKFNDIALCIIAGGLREYLQNTNELPAESLVTGMPIDVRSKNNNTTIGNQLSFANINLFTDIEDPKSRLESIHKASTHSKEEVQRIGPKSFISVINNLNPGILVWSGEQLVNSGLINKLPLLNNTITTNVPGIQLPCYMCGAKIVDYVGFGPLAPNITLFHVISSIHSHFNISFQSCSNSLDNEYEYTQALENSYQCLMKAYNLTTDTKS